MNVETDFTNIGTMDKAVEADAVTNQQRKESIEDEVIPEVFSGTASANVVTMDKSVEVIC